jgi:hypothetical protein
LQYIRYYLNKYTVGEFVLSDSYTPKVRRELIKR